METFAGTASRASQRLVNSAAAQEPDWVFFCFDISQAFAKGMDFAEMARHTGTPLRAAEFDNNPRDIHI